MNSSILKKQSFTSALFYYFCSSLAYLIFKIFCRIHLIILEKPAQQGAFIVASNHISHFEPSLLSALFPRPIDWVAMDELFYHPWSARFFSWLQVIPIDRSGNNKGSNRSALKKIITRLNQQRVVGLFPEGGIRSGKESILEKAPMKPGLITLSLLSQTPIIPCVILGTDRLYVKKSILGRTPLWVIIGKAITPPKPNTADFQQAQKDFEQKLIDIFPSLKQELCQRFHLTNEDLPKTAQERRS